MIENSWTKDFIRISKSSLPNGDVIKTLPTISLSEFGEVLNGLKYYEDTSHKIYNPGIFNTNKSLFLDLDHIDEHFDAIWGCLDDIIQDCPFIAIVKQSRSKSLHFICVGGWGVPEEHAERDMYYLACVAKSILLHTGVDLREIKGALDVHTKSCDQRLFVYDPKLHPFIINEFATPISLDRIDKAFEEYPMLSPRKKEDTKVASNFEGAFDATSRQFSDRILLDRNYCICGFTGNDARWRVANAVAYLCKGDLNKARKIIEDNFKNPNDFSFASVSKGYHLGVLNWVMENIQSKCGGKLDGYLLDKVDEVIRFNTNHPRTLLVAPTGAGKTTLINGTGSVDGLAKRMNAIVVPPFNAMLQLYSSMTIIKSDPLFGSNIQDYRKDEPCTIIWDQLVKIIDKVIEDDRVVIVDESHTLFLDRSFRDSAVKLMQALKKVRRLICVTATPTGEEAELGLERLEFKANKSLIMTNIIHTKDNIGVSMFGDLMYELKANQYNRVVVFSDMYAMRLHENLAERMVDHTLVHARRKSADFEDLRLNEILRKRITICTRLAFNGLNFKNKDEHILVLMDMREGDMVAANVIQCVGRMRNSNVTLRMYWVEKGEQSTVDQKKLKADLLSGKSDDELRVDQELFQSDVRLTVPEVYQARKTIEDYISSHGTLEVVKKELQDTGYFVIREDTLDPDRDPIKGKLRLEEKQKMENAWAEGFLNYQHPEDSAITSNEYYRNVNKMWEQLRWNYAYRPEALREILENKRPNQLVSGILQELNMKCRVATYMDDEFNRQMIELEQLVNKYEKELGDVQVKQLRTTIKKCREWRDKYKSEIPGNIPLITDTDGQDLVLKLEEQYKKASEAHSVKHKQHKQKLLKLVSDGFVGTREEMAEHIGKNPNTVTIWKQKGKIVDTE